MSAPIEGGCYCGELRYRCEGKPAMKAQCLCRECQYITGGGPNFFMAMPLDGFTYTKGTPKKFARSDLEAPRVRDFCETCGTHIATLPPGRPVAIIKIGSLDDPATAYGGPDMAIFGIDKQNYHCVEEGMPIHERLPW